MHTPVAETGLGNLAIMHDYFKTPHFQMEDVLFFVFTIVVVILFLFLAYTLLKRKMLKQQYKPRGAIREPVNIAKMLNLCVDRRIKLDTYLDKETGGRYMPCSPIGLENDILHLECAAADFPSSILSDKSKELLFYFKYKVGSKTLNYYFKSSIISFFLEKNGFLDLSVALPEAIELGQKRSALRIKPPDKLINEISIWPLLLDGRNRPEPDTAKWGEGVLKCANGDFSEFRLQDISAHGARILIPRSSTNIEGLAFDSVSAQMVFKFDLWDPAQQHSLVIWTIGRIEKATEDYTTKATQAGIQFIAWAMQQNNAPGTLQWKKLATDDAIEALADWVLQRHLEICREESLFTHVDGRSR